MSGWLHVEQGDAPLIISVPHAGIVIPDDMGASLVSPERARYDADLYIDRLYGFARELGATLVRTDISRTVIDVNRDPDGISLYPGQATTGLCPVTTFDGDPLYRPGCEPGDVEIAGRRAQYFTPYHAALDAEIVRLRGAHPRIVLYEAHSIRSLVPRLFDGELPQFNIGTNDDTTCEVALTRAVEAISAASSHSHVVNGRFKGGWTTRHYGRPEQGVHAIQMELAMRGYLDETHSWPPPWDGPRAAGLQPILSAILSACITFAREFP